MYNFKLVLKTRCYLLSYLVQVKIQGQNKEMLATACQMFMGKSEAQIAQIALETLEGHQRAIIAHLTVEVCADVVTRLYGYNTFIMMNIPFWYTGDLPRP